MKSNINNVLPTHVEDFLEDCYPDGLIFLNGSFLAYSNGYWKKLNTHADVIKNIGKHLKADACSKFITEIYNMLKVFCIVKNEDFIPADSHICFLNGTLDLATYQLVPHNPDFHLRSGRDFNWHEDTGAPTFEKYLYEVFRDDPDREEKIQFVREWMGLCLVPDTSFEKFVVCVGEGGNGKSVWLKLMPELLGQESVYSAPITRLGSRRTLAELHGKLLLTSSEINENTVMDDGILKQIVSGDTIEGERKYEHPFTFTPSTRIMLATNHLPKLRDVTHAFFRRLIMLKFNRNFTADEMDIELPAKLEAELAGIFAVAVAGLRTLRERGHFKIPRSSTEAADEYRISSDFIKLFTDDALVDSGIIKKGMRPEAVYILYTSWCRIHGVRPDNNINLGKRLKQIGFEKTRSNGKDYWRVDMTETGKDILSKQSARVEDIQPDNQPEFTSSIDFIKPEAEIVGQAEHVEEERAA